ncbi:hypothetical protein [Pseudoxanthomonas dokdonensis]|uniref:Uncharacterized protein n=1 Tax=Pseudoxanthomonas dokdonensis TaxID=344882 RepID=A0A0R0CQF9_9GAMM|nr:hypothetical protein [Pseudoxanthomonas dokdonensis]KRG71680.1 hypothetical protein ABB29_02730 [Pseudoxanthomonas dokdonensis]
MSNQNFASMHAELGPLAFLSIQHTERGRTPQAPTNEERVRAYRNTQPVLQGNAYEWPFRPSQMEAVAV